MKNKKKSEMEEMSKLNVKVEENEKGKSERDERGGRYNCRCGWRERIEGEEEGKNR